MAREPDMATRAAAAPLLAAAIDNAPAHGWGDDKIGDVLGRMEANAVAERIAGEVVFGRPTPAPKPAHAPAPAREEPHGRTRTFRRGLIRRIVRADGP